jgi:hypothetical protein
VQPGIEVRAPDDLALTTPLDLLTQRYGGQAGVLTLRAGGNLTIGASLSDGLLAGFDGLGNPVESAQTVPSWSYNLVRRRRPQEREHARHGRRRVRSRRRHRAERGHGPHGDG